MTKARSHLANAALAGAVLYWVVDLGRSGRTVVDWIVIAVVASAIVANLVRLGRGLYAKVAERRRHA